MLTSFELRDFKSFDHARLELSPFTVLVGRKASGKSNLLDALLVMKALALGYSVAEVFGGSGEGRWPGIRGGRSMPARSGCGSSSVHLSTFVHGDSYTPEVETDGDHLLSESVGNLFHAARHGAMLRVELEDGCGLDPGEDRTLAIPATHSTLVPMPNPKCAHWLGPFVHTLAGMRLAELDTQAMRDYATKSSEPLSSTGHKLSAVPWRLCEDAAQKACLLTWLEELCVTEVADIEFIEPGGTDDVMLRVREPSEASMPARSLSDGTLRFLGILAAVMTAGEGEPLIFEEIEIGFHPDRVRLLPEFFDSELPREPFAGGGGQRDLQILATSHSARLLEQVPENRMHGVHVVGRSHESGGSVIRRMDALPVDALPDFAAARERLGVERMLSTGWLDRAL